MTVVRRATQLVAIVTMLTIGSLLILSASGAIGDRWRGEVADWIDDLGTPGASEWVLALVGATVSVAALVLLVSQLAPRPEGNHHVYDIDLGDNGATRIRGRAVTKAVRHTVEQIDHVSAADARWSGKSVDVELHVDDEANLDAVERAAREALGHPFWIDMGLADIGVNVLVVHTGNQRQHRN